MKTVRLAALLATLLLVLSGLALAAPAAGPSATPAAQSDDGCFDDGLGTGDDSDARRRRRSGR